MNSDMQTNRSASPSLDCRVTGLMAAQPWATWFRSWPTAGVSSARSWADAVSRRYRHLIQSTTPVGTVLVRPPTPRVWTVDATYRTDLRLTPRLELTVAVHRREESLLVQRLLTRIERREAQPPGAVAARVSSPANPGVVHGGGARLPAWQPPVPRRDTPPVPGFRFDPVPRVVHTQPSTAQAASPPPIPGTGQAPSPIPGTGDGPWPVQSDPAPPPGRPAASSPEPAAVDVDRLAERVIRTIDRRVIAQRERQGRA